MAHGNPVSVQLTTKAGVTPCVVTLHSAVIAGWTARDVSAMEKHINELEELGVARPASTPIYLPCRRDPHHHGRDDPGIGWRLERRS